METEIEMEDVFRSLPIKYFYRYENTLCDVYLKLNDEKFIKFVNAGDSISNEILKSFESKNVVSFYVLKRDFDQVGMNLIPQSASPDNKSTLPDNKELNQLLFSIGISPYTCTEVAKIYEKFLGDQPRNLPLSKVLSNMIFNKKRFIYDHSYLTGAIAIELAKKFDWNIVSYKEKLMLAAIMHDLRMPEDLATIADCNNLSESVTNQVKQAHANHAHIMATELNNELSISSDVVKIVKDHHNLQDTSLGHLVMAFIVTHEFVIRMYNYQLNSSMAPQALKDVQSFLKDAHFEKYLLELTKMVLK